MWREKSFKMRFKVYRALAFATTTLNLSISLVQYERFRRERRAVMNGNKSEDDDLVVGQTSKTNLMCRDMVELKSKPTLKPKSGFIHDVLEMLLYNQNGLMYLFLYLVCNSVLVVRIPIAILFSTFPTHRDPSTGQFINPWLNYMERLYITDVVYKIDRTNIFNRILLIMTIQCLILRFRAFYIMLQTAKTNKDSYKDINLIHIDWGYVCEMSCTIQEWLRDIVRCYKHNCTAGQILSKGNLRKAIIEFNQKIKTLSKIDRNYYFNPLFFNPCFEGITFLDDYEKKIKSLFPDEQEPILRNLDTNGNYFESGTCELDRNNKSNEETKKKNVSWFEYIFYINLPNRVRFIPRPKHKVDLSEGFWLIVIYIYATLLVIIAIVGCSLVCFYIALLDQDYKSMDSNARVRWERLLRPEIFITTTSNVFLVVLLANSAYENGLLAYAGLLCLSRARKITLLLKKEVEFIRLHNFWFGQFYDNHKYVSTVRSSYFNDISSEGVKFTSLNKYQETINLFMREDFSFRHEQRSAFPDHKSQLTTKSTLLKLRKKSTKKKYCNCSVNNEDYLEFHQLIQIYKSKLNETSLQQFNENISYILDLIQMFQATLIDYKLFFTQCLGYLNINMIFGTASFSLSITLFLNATSFYEASTTLATCIASILPMLWAIAVGTASEYAFLMVYRQLLPVMVNELRLIEPEVIKRVSNLCNLLVQNENRSFIIFGFYPICLGTLMEVSDKLRPRE